MDAWCSLWVWGPENGARLPDLDEWLSAIESILNVKQGPRTGLLFEEDDVDLDPNLEWRAAVTNKYPWLEECITIAETSGWLHWELEFSPVFGAGGFDLVLGNPPWTKVTRTDTDVLIDAEPSWAIHGVPRDPDQYSREKESLLKDKELRIDLLTESASSQGLSRLLSARTRFPMTSATITNLYLCFMEQAFRLMAGACGLLHQESFFEDHKAPRLRSEVMLRLRRHWHFMNELLLFEEVHHETEFGVHIYGRRLATPAHLYAANLLHPTTADRSLERFQLGDRSGELPGKKTSDGEWDIRPHAARLIEVNETALRAFARLERIEYQIDAPPRPLRLYSDVELELLELLTDRPRSVGALGVMFSSGIHESSMARPGPKQLIEKRVAIPDSLENTVLKGPNVNVANPCYQQANAGYSHSNDLEIIDLHSIEESFLPRTVIQVVADPTIIRRRLHEKDGWDSAGAWRVMWPEHVSRGIVRMFQPALIPPLILHGHSCMTASTPDSGDLLRLASVGSTAVYELLLRMLGTDHIGEPELSGLPWPPEDHPAWPLMEARCLRLNAVTRFHAEMWAACFSTTWLDDTSVLNDSRAPVYNHIHAEWDFGSAIRGELARWITLAEMDALAALLFDIPLELLLTVYGLHLGLQARYDQRTVFDADGYKIAADRYNMGTKQRKTAEYGLAIDVREGRRLLGETEGLEAYSEPFTKFERTDLVESAHRQFSTRLGLSR